MRPIVHVGYHKTATTWFQHEVYPRATSHRWIPRAKARTALLAPSGLAFDADIARSYLGDSDDTRPPVICEENLSGYIHNGGLHGLLAPEAARRIKAVYPDALIVITIRAQPQVISASYVQYVRGGGTMGVRDYLGSASRMHGALRHQYKASRFSFEHFEYDRLITFYDRLFGSDSVIVLLYETLRNTPSDFLAELQRRTGLAIDLEAVCYEHRNASFGPVTITLGRILNRFTARSVANKHYLINLPGYYRPRGKLLNLLGRLEGGAPPGRVLGHAMVDHIRQYYAGSNRRLAQLRPLDLRSLGYP